MNEKIVDEDGVVHDQRWDGQFRPTQGLFGPKRETNWLGNPKVDRNWLGNPVQERNWLGTQRTSASGEPLYRTSSSGSGGSDVAAGLAGGLVLVLVLAAVFVIGAALALMFKVLAALAGLWGDLVRRYPRAMLTIHLSLGMAVVFGGAQAAGVDQVRALASTVIVPSTWAWQWLTRRWPYVLMPINSAAIGMALWYASRSTASYWLPTWSRLTIGLPALENLPVVVGVLPLVAWFWALGMRRWPSVFALANCGVAGGVTWFLFTRVWTDWQPYWDAWTAPVPLLPPASWLLLSAPLGVWFWSRAQSRWPTLMAPVNLLLVGGVIGLTAQHTESHWRGSWNHWASGLPIATVPIAAISLAPVSAWSWRQGYVRWPHVFVVPSLLLLGALLYLVLDRTRPSWSSEWLLAWGAVPLRPDLATLVGAIPVVLWCSRELGRRWLVARWGISLALNSLVLWWLTERMRGTWTGPWGSFAGEAAPDPVLVAASVPTMLAAWSWLHRRSPDLVLATTTVGVGALIGWTLSRLLPGSALTLQAGAGAVPFVLWTNLWLLRHYPRVGWAVLLLPLVGMATAGAVWPEQGRLIADALRAWLSHG